MVGTNTTRRPSRCQARTRSRTSAIVVTVSMSEAVLGRRILALLDGTHVALERIEVVVRALHEVAHEAGLAPGSDVEHVVGDQDLAVAVRACADADDRDAEVRGDLRAERRRNALEQHDVGAGRLELARLGEQSLSLVPLPPLDAKAAGLVHR